MSSLYISLVTSSATMDFGYDTYLVDASSNNITLELPESYGDGPNFIISRIDSSVNTVTIIGFESGPTINGQSSVSLESHQNVKLALFSDNWYTVGGTWLS